MSEHPTFTAVAVRDVASGRYLGPGATWTADGTAALVLDAPDAARLVDRHSCEPVTVELVPAAALARAVA